MKILYSVFRKESPDVGIVIYVVLWRMFSTVDEDHQCSIGIFSTPQGNHKYFAYYLYSA